MIKYLEENIWRKNQENAENTLGCPEEALEKYD